MTQAPAAVFRQHIQAVQLVCQVGRQPFARVGAVVGVVCVAKTGVAKANHATSGTIAGCAGEPPRGAGGSPI